jgi:hypothetical protein
MKRAKTERRKMHRVMRWLDHYLPDAVARAITSYLNTAIIATLRKGEGVYWDEVSRFTVATVRNSDSLKHQNRQLPKGIGDGGTQPKSPHWPGALGCKNDGTGAV